MDVLRIATRRSTLALAQSHMVGATLASHRPGLEVEYVELVTTGDRILDRPLREAGGKSLFVKEIEAALLDGRADLAIHSLKDLPTELPVGLRLAAVPEREDPCDALIAREPVADLAELPLGARVGTASLRRASLLLYERPDLEIISLRGNVDTRLLKLQGGEFDAIILAEAGLNRLGRADVVRLRLDPMRFVAAAGQGALGLEIAEGRPDLDWIAETMEHEPTRLAVEVERAFLEEVEGSCKVPVGAHASWRGDLLAVTACVGDARGDVVTVSLERDSITDNPAARALGFEIAERLIVAGGRNVIDEFIRPTPEVREEVGAAPHEGRLLSSGRQLSIDRPLSGTKILVTRSRSQASRLSSLLTGAGAVPMELPSIETIAVEGDELERLDGALRSLESYDWIVFTSPNGVEFTVRRLAELGLTPELFSETKLASIGTATTTALGLHGLEADLVPQRFVAEGLLEAMESKVSVGSRFLILRAREARAILPEGLRALGAEVEDVAAYYSTVPVGLQTELEAILSTPPELLTFASSKTVENLSRAAGGQADRLRNIPVACIGPVTRRAAMKLGFNVVVQPHTFTIDGLVTAIIRWRGLLG